MSNQNWKRCGLRTSAIAAWLISSFLGHPSAGYAQEAAEQARANRQDAETVVAVATSSDSSASSPQKLPEPKGAQRLSPEFDVWIDPKEKAVLIDGQISLREGMLEMFACTRNTKEHESIVSANTQAFLVHAALLRLGAEPGRPVQWQPEYKPPSGTEIDIQVWWIDERGKEHTARAQEWVKDMRTNKEMSQPWVFAGSRFWTDEETKQQYYQAEGGDFICVSNFGTAMLDIPIESSQSNLELAFAAFTERIPPLGAPVRLILKPKLKERERGAGSRERGAGSGEQGAGSGEQGAGSGEQGAQRSSRKR